MGFASPWFLALAAAVALPVWLHLLRRNRSTPRPFSSVMFWEPRTETSVRRRRLQYLLLFALRAALLVLIALAFARPYIETQGPPAGRRNVVLAVDVTASMREGNRMARAKRLATAELRRAGDARVIALGRTGIVQPASALPALQATAQSGSLSELGRSVRSLGEREPLEVHLFSDFQKTALPPAFIDLQMPANAKLVLHPVVDGAVGNWAVERVTAPARLYGADRTRVQVTLRGFGADAATRRVSVFIDGKSAGSREVSVPANGRATADFDLRDLPYGLNRGEARIEPGDSLAADDRYYFAIDRAEPHPVLYIGDHRGAVYFRAALESAPGSPFRMQEGTAEGRYAFIVVAGSAPAWVADYIRKGGAALFAVNTRMHVDLLGDFEPVYYGREGERFQAVSWMDASHPVLRDANLWTNVRFFQVARVPGLKTLARLGDGVAVLSEARVGGGRVLVFGSGLDNLANDFPLHNAFVPFVVRAAAYLSGIEETAPQHVTGSAVELTPGVPVEVLDPHGLRPLSLAEARTARSFELSEEGFYELRRGGGRSELLAVNTDRRESDLAVAPRETLDLWAKSSESADAKAPGPAGDTRTRRELWPYLLAAAILAALAESFTGSRYFGERRTEALRKGAAA